MSKREKPAQVVIIGAGFCGLTAAYELVKRGVRVTVLEREPALGGLAGSFFVNGCRLEKFYHHWFTTDRHVTELIHELGEAARIVARSSRTGIFYANTIFRLSKPLDVVRFQPLPLIDRFRLGLLPLRARYIRDWKKLEEISAAQWLRELTGTKVYEVVWEPLLRGKFGVYAGDVSAVWFWNKLKLRGGSRNRGGSEQLMYYRGGFAALVDSLADGIRSRGGEIHTNSLVSDLLVSENRCVGVQTENEQITADVVIATTPLPVVASLVAPHLPHNYVSDLRRIRYLANICIVLELDRSLSETYWLNVNDPKFPFVGVIEHTNFEPRESYGGRHIVYLSKYLPEIDPFYQMDDKDALNYTLPHLKRMFPTFDIKWVQHAHIWRAPYAQPIVERRYSSLIPASTTPLSGLYIASMAQIYPEDRGTNFAVRDGKSVAALVHNALVRE